MDKLAEFLRKENELITASGKYFNPFDPKPELVDINDIAHALSQQCRFSGHTSSFYSVADHSINVARMVNEDIFIYALLHDAAEAYMIDLPSPIKRQFKKLYPPFCTWETQIEFAIYQAFGIKYPTPAIFGQVKHADQEILKFEFKSLLLEKKTDPERMKLDTHPMRTKKLFLALFNEHYKKATQYKL